VSSEDGYEKPAVNGDSEYSEICRDSKMSARDSQHSYQEIRPTIT